MANNNQSNSGKKNYDGARAVAEMLAVMDKESREKMLTNIKKSNPSMAQTIRQKMFIFEDLVKLDGPGLRMLLREVPPDKLRLALRTATEEMKKKIFENMSERASNQLREDLDSQGPQRQSAVTTAQNEIAEIAAQILSEKD